MDSTTMQNMNYIMNYLFGNVDYENINETKVSTFIISCDVKIKSDKYDYIDLSKYQKYSIDFCYRDDKRKDEKITIEYGNQIFNKIIICFNVANYFDTIDDEKLKTHIKNILVYNMVYYADSEQDKEKITEDIIDISNIKYEIIKTYSPEYGILKYVKRKPFYYNAEHYNYINIADDDFDMEDYDNYSKDVGIRLINDYHELKDIFINVRLSKVFSNPYFVGSLQSKIRKILKEDFYENITNFDKDFYEFPIYENGEIKPNKIDLTMPDIIKPLFDIYKMYNKYINNE